MIKCQWCNRDVVAEEGERYHVDASLDLICGTPSVCECGESLFKPAGADCPWPEQHPTP